MIGDIEEFQGEYRWLSNFWPCEIELNGIIYPSVENAYQASKFSKEDLDWKNPFIDCKPGFAKRLGKPIKLTDEQKLETMELLLRKKFNIPEFKKRLLETGDRYIIEGNKWKDEFWGICNGKGHNYLGKLIMKIRKELSDNFTNS